MFALMFLQNGLRRSQTCMRSGCVNLTILQHTSIRLVSSTPNSSRKFPGSNPKSRFTPWQRRFAIGIVIGVASSQAWLYYERTKARDSFVTYKLVAREPVSSTASIFHLEPSESSQDFEIYKQAWRSGVWNVHFKQPQIQIVRAYTPLPPLEAVENKAQSQLRFLIRHDPHGEVSSYLHRLPIGSIIDLRGPNLEYNLAPDVRQVVFFAGGTGIAPALQIAHAMFENDSAAAGVPAEQLKNRKLHILWASRKREDCLGGVSDAPSAEPTAPKATWSGLFTKQKVKASISVGEGKGLIVKELDDLKKKYPGQITVEYFVNSESTWIDEDAVFNSLSRFDDKDFSSGSPSSQEQRQILISGPSGFITHLAGPKEWRNGREEQGPVSRIVAHAIAQNPHHVKVWKI